MVIRDYAVRAKDNSTTKLTFDQPHAHASAHASAHVSQDYMLPYKRSWMMDFGSQD